MPRSIAAILAVCAVTLSVRADSPALHAGAGKQPDQPAPADVRKKIIAEIDADGEHAIDRLKARDAGAATHASQQRILDNLDKLLKEQPPKPSAGNQSQPPKPMPETPTAPLSKPKPGATGVEPTPGVPSAEKPKHPADQGPWPHLRPGKRQQMDAIPSERLIRNYEEALRAYYRTIAESKSRKDAD